MFLILVNILMLVVGCFLDTIAAITILVPILLTVAARYGVDPVHFGLIMTLNLMIGLLHPPLGMVLFVLSRVAKLSVERTTMAILPWLVPLLLALLLITFVPAITLWLPQQVGLIRRAMTCNKLQSQPLCSARGSAHGGAAARAAGGGMVRIKFGAAGICGSDMHYFPPCPHRQFRRHFAAGAWP